MAEKLRTIHITVNISQTRPVVDHDFMRASGIHPDIGNRPVIGIAHIELFTQLKLNVRDGTVSGSVRTSQETQHLD